ncbi:MAG: GNAT family N-acetyltransferase [Candidatus Margulisiibacteriota bacterium]
MDISYDYWQGESLETVVQSIAEFRMQVLRQNNEIQTKPLSDQINFLQHYFDSEATVIVANDCGFIVGYLGLVTQLDFHPLLSEYSYYGPDLVTTEGPIVHPDYRGQGIGKSLIMESINHCQTKDIELIIFDPSKIRTSMDHTAITHLATIFDFFDISQGDELIYKKEVEPI